MEIKDLHLNSGPIDNITDYGKGQAPKIDNITDYGNGQAPKINKITDYGRGISYKTYDGKESPAIEEVYNEMFYEKMMNNPEGKGRHR